MYVQIVKILQSPNDLRPVQEEEPTLQDECTVRPSWRWFQVISFLVFFFYFWKFQIRHGFRVEQSVRELSETLLLHEQLRCLECSCEYFIILVRAYYSRILNPNWISLLVYWKISHWQLVTFNFPKKRLKMLSYLVKISGSIRHSVRLFQCPGERAAGRVPNSASSVGRLLHVCGQRRSLLER